MYLYSFPFWSPSFSAHLSDMPGIHRNSLEAWTVIFDFPKLHSWSTQGGRSWAVQFVTFSQPEVDGSLQITGGSFCKIKAETISFS